MADRAFSLRHKRAVIFSHEAGLCGEVKSIDSRSGTFGDCFLNFGTIGGHSGVCDGLFWTIDDNILLFFTELSKRDIFGDVIEVHDSVKVGPLDGLDSGFWKTGQSSLFDGEAWIFDHQSRVCFDDDS